MRRLFLIRHGETSQNREGRMVSTQDPPLSPEGQRQIQTLAPYLMRWPIEAIITSPMRRCQETAELLAGGRNGLISVDERLREIGFGAIEGLTPAEIDQAGLGDIFRSWRQGYPVRYPEGAESFDAAAERMSSAYREVTEQHDCAVIVGHSHSLRILLADSVLGVGVEAHRRMRLFHGSFTEIQWEGAAPRLTALNSWGPGLQGPQKMAH
ncbi:histidine phosphatase family protein [Kocuria rhizosphaericola]|uniref:histidine phosphatase family protein n=1 Tax=Kocuria rhizosphaericola TaxID=3376284 RepID=UPI0037B6EEB3